MKTGIRTPNIKKSVKARTTGKVKRAVKKSVNPMYGKKGAGFVKDPARSVKNSVYKKTTIGVSDVLKQSDRNKNIVGSDSNYHVVENARPAALKKKKDILSIVLIILGVMFIIGGLNGFSIAISNGIFGLTVGCVLLFLGIWKRKLSIK